MIVVELMSCEAGGSVGIENVWSFICTAKYGE